MRIVPRFGECYDTAEVAKLCKVSDRTVINWMTRGSRGRKLSHHRLGNTRFVSPEQLAEFSAAEPVKAPAVEVNSTKASPEVLERLRRHGFKI